MKNRFKKFASRYFITTAKVLSKYNDKENVTLRFCSFSDSFVLSGIKFIKELILKSLTKQEINMLDIYSLDDGQIVKKGQPILIIKGNYKVFSWLENIIDGILARCSSVATNCYKITSITNKEIIFMADRSDLYINQEYDGYSAYIGGIKFFTTLAQMKYISDKECAYVGTIPHSFIQQYDGNLVNALIDYHKYFPNERLVALIDFNNDCISEIEKLSESNLKNLLYAVRLDTSKSLVDKCLQKKYQNWQQKKELYGVSIELIKIVREKLDQLGMNKVKIIISSGIDDERVKEIESVLNCVDIYGIGSFFLNPIVNITGDLIKTNDKYFAKAGRDENIDNYLSDMIKW